MRCQLVDVCLIRSRTHTHLVILLRRSHTAVVVVPSLTRRDAGLGANTGLLSVDRSHLDFVWEEISLCIEYNTGEVSSATRIALDHNAERCT